MVRENRKYKKRKDADKKKLQITLLLLYELYQCNKELHCINKHTTSLQCINTLHLHLYTTVFAAPLVLTRTGCLSDNLARSSTGKESTENRRGSIEYIEQTWW